MKIKPLNLNCIQCGKPATRRATQDTKAFKHRDGSIIPSMIVTARSVIVNLIFFLNFSINI